MKLRPIANPPNPYESVHAEWLEPPPLASLEILEDNSQSILSKVESPDLPFQWSVNPYRGCQHACSYCYARPYHEYLGFGAGTDFDTKLVAKPNAPALLRKALTAKKWKRELINFSGVTDCYQPIEASLGITRSCLQVCLELENPVAIVTKGFLVARDADLLAQIHRVAGAWVYVSIPIYSESVSRIVEPQASSPSRRLEAIRLLVDAGVPVGVMVAPVIPGLNDRDIPTVLEKAAAAGATRASYTMLRLPGSVQQVFVERLQRELPDRAKRVLTLLNEIKKGRLNDMRFGHRMVGEGPYWEGIRDLFEISAQRFGLQTRIVKETFASEKSRQVVSKIVNEDQNNHGSSIKVTTPNVSQGGVEQMTFGFAR